MLYKGDKGVNDAARPLKGSQAEVRGVSASSLPLLDSAPAGVKANNKMMPSASSPGRGHLFVSASEQMNARQSG